MRQIFGWEKISSYSKIWQPQIQVPSVTLTTVWSWDSHLFSLHPIDLPTLIFLFYEIIVRIFDSNYYYVVCPGY
jgi:hypothetical protein